MTDAKAVMTPMAAHFKLSGSQVPQSGEDKEFERCGQCDVHYGV